MDAASEGGANRPDGRSIRFSAQIRRLKVTSQLWHLDTGQDMAVSIRFDWLVIPGKAHASRETVRRGTARETGVGHAGAEALQVPLSSGAAESSGLPAMR